MSKYRYNVIRDRPDPRDLRVALPTMEDVAALPTTSDMRGAPTMPEIWDQGQEGDCTAYGNGAVFEIERRMQGLSPMTPACKFIMRAERKVEGDINEDNGAQVRTGPKVMAAVGVPPEALYPDTTDDFTTEPAPEVYAEALKHRVTKYEGVAPVPQVVCATLAKGRPVVFGFDVYSRFEGSDVAKTGILQMPQHDEAELGGHCVCAVGYVITAQGGKHGGFFGPLLDRIFGENQLSGFLICRNSWGADWGQAGYFTMPFDYLTHGLASDFWVVDVVDG